MPVSTYKLKIGGSYCRCSACGEVFSGITGFDMHRVGPYDETRSCTPLQGSEVTMLSPTGKERTFKLEHATRGSFWRLV